MNAHTSVRKIIHLPAWVTLDLSKIVCALRLFLAAATRPVFMIEPKLIPLSLFFDGNSPPRPWERKPCQTQANAWDKF